MATSLPPCWAESTRWCFRQSCEGERGGGWHTDRHTHFPQCVEEYVNSQSSPLWKWPPIVKTFRLLFSSPEWRLNLSLQVRCISETGTNKDECCLSSVTPLFFCIMHKQLVQLVDRKWLQTRSNSQCVIYSPDRAVSGDRGWDLNMQYVAMSAVWFSVILTVPHIQQMVLVFWPKKEKGLWSVSLNNTPTQKGPIYPNQKLKIYYFFVTCDLIFFRALRWTWLKPERGWSSRQSAPTWSAWVVDGWAQPSPCCLCLRVRHLLQHQHTN